MSAVLLTIALYLYLKEEDFPKMNIEKYVQIAPWLQFVGLMVAIGGLLALSHWIGKPLAYVGVGVSFTGFAYEKIYR